MGRSTGAARRIEPGPGQESVWDYPRPPRLEPTERRIRIRFNGETIAESGRAYRVLPNVDDSPSKAGWLAEGWGEHTLADELLFDLVFDPGEAHNLAADPAYADVKAALADRLEQWMRATGDPLLHGPVIAPGSEVNDVDGLSPSEPTMRLP